MVLQMKVTEKAVINRAKSVTSQIVACIAQNILLIDLGMSIGFITVTVPVLLNAPSGLSLNEEEASWFGSLSFLCTPIGCLFSGPTLDFFGRRRAMILVNIPHLIAWPLLHFASNVPSLYAATVLLGIGVGLMEGPCNAYISETSEPYMRGILTTSTNIFFSMGVLLMFLISTVLAWREAALAALLLPLCAMAFTYLAPETPSWLLSKERPKEALKSLCQLRGWTKPENVEKEFKDLVEYHKQISQCAVCLNLGKIPTKDKCEHKSQNSIQRLWLKLGYLIRTKEIMRPFYMVMCYFTFFSMSGFIPLKPNMVNICGALGMDEDGKKIIVYVGLITLGSNVLATVIIRFTGKRKLGISAMFCCFLSLAALSLYVKLNLSDDVSSYNVNTFPVEKSITPLVLFYLMVVFNGLAIPWVVLPEVIPFSARGTVIGIVAAFHYVVMFLGSKTLIDVESSFGLWGAFALYTGFSFVGTIYLYFFLPETENKSLIQIEEFYSGKLRTFADDPFINCFNKCRRRRGKGEITTI